MPNDYCLYTLLGTVFFIMQDTKNLIKKRDVEYPKLIKEAKIKGDDKTASYWEFQLEQVKSNGLYISRQDTVKRGWIHKRIIKNELELIDEIKNKLNYDIVEMMDMTMKEKIQISKYGRSMCTDPCLPNISEREKLI